MMFSMGGVAQAIRYGVEAARLLVRRPSLLLLAAALGAFSAADTLVANSYTWHHTALARDMQRFSEAQLGDGKRKAQEAANHRSHVMASRLTITSPSAPSLDVGGTLTAAWSLVYGPAGKNLDPAHMPPVVLLYVVVLWALSSPVPIAIMVYSAGGFMAVVKEVVAAGEVRWGSLLPGARRVFWRLIFLSLISLLLYSLTGQAAALPGAAGEVLSWMLVAAALPLVLADFAVIWDDCRVPEALARSVRTVTRALPLAVALVAGAGLLQWASERPLAAALEHVSADASPLRSLPPGALLGMVLSSLVGTWFCTASFLWYRATTSEPAAVEKTPVKPGTRGWWEQ